MLSAGALTMQAGGLIDSSTDGLGSGGNISVSVSGTALISGQDAQHFDSRIVAVSNPSGQGGNAGKIMFTAGNLTLQAGGTISSSTQGLGNGGDITVGVSGDALLSGVDSQGSASGIFAGSFSSGRGGDAGAVTMTAGSLQVLDGARISTTTLGTGNGGNINVAVAGAAVFDTQGYSPAAIAGDSSTPVVGIAAAANPGATGNAGSIMLTANSLQILNGAAISSATSGVGAGGNVTVNVTKNALLTGVSAQDAASGVFADSYSQAQGGHAGNITMTAAGLRVAAGAEISSSTYGMGNGGSVNVAVSGTAVFDAQGFSAHVVGITAVSESGATGNAGDVTLTADDLRILNGAAITSSTGGSGMGGNVVVSGGTVRLLHGGLISASSGAAGTGGSVYVAARTGILLRQASQISVQATVANAGNLSGQLVVLPNALLSIETTLQDVCAQRLNGNFSSFILTGQGGLAMEPGGWLPSVMAWDSLMSLSLSPLSSANNEFDPPPKDDSPFGCCCGGSAP